MEFEILLDEMVAPGSLRDAIHFLIEKKSEGAELDRGLRIPNISDFITTELRRLEETKFAKTPKVLSIEPLNELFRLELKEVYGWG